MTHPRFLAHGVGASLALALLVPAAPALAADGTALLDVTSDVQGDTDDFGVVLDNYASFEPADALVVDGDLTINGYEEQYREFFATLGAHPHPEQTFFAIGNHEYYNDDPVEVAQARFREHTGMPGIYSRSDVDGVPVLFLGSVAEPGEWTVGNQVELAEQQLAWLDAQLDSVPADQPVLLFSHHPLPAATSGTIGEGRQTYYDLDYKEIDRLLEILGDHPNVTFFSGHTHYSLHREDGTNRVVVPGGDPRGFVSVNTGAVELEWGPNAGGPDQGEWGGAMDFKQNLRVAVEGSRVTITYLDHLAREVIREVTYDVTGDGALDVRGDVAWPVRATDDGDIPVQAEIPGVGSGEEPVPGSLVMSVEEGTAQLANARNAGDRLRLSGVLPTVSVTDSRAQASGWSVTGQSSDLSAGSAVVRADRLGWAPFVEAGNARPGAPVATSLSGGPGLAAPATLGTGAGETRVGTADLAADMVLETPVDTKAGAYTGGVTVSLFPQD